MVSYSVITGQKFIVESHCDFDEIIINNRYSPEYIQHNTMPTKYIILTERITEDLGNHQDISRHEMLFKLKGEIVDKCILHIYPDQKRKYYYEIS